MRELTTCPLMSLGNEKDSPNMRGKHSSLASCFYKDLLAREFYMVHGVCQLGFPTCRREYYFCLREGCMETLRIRFVFLKFLVDRFVEELKAGLESKRLKSAWPKSLTAISARQKQTDTLCRMLGIGVKTKEAKNET